jgi:hypothetical protein
LEPISVPEPFRLMGTVVRSALTNGSESWTERVDLVAILAHLLESHGHLVTRGEKWVTLDESGLVLEPQLVGMEPMEGRAVKTVTIIAARHPAIQNGSGAARRPFEYQHSTGAQGMEESISKGFDSWRQGDLPVLLDALRAEPKVCTAMIMDFPEKDGVPKRRRRVLLGPVQYVVQRPLPTEEAGGEEGGEKPHPSFCACCLFTNTWQTFQSLLESEGFYAIRFFGARFENGLPQADSRVNGEEFEEGKTAIRQYVEKWADQGVEFRKQYVVIQSVDATSALPA